MDKIPYGSDSYRKLNPHVFGGVGTVQTKVAKPTTSRSLDDRQPRVKKGKGGLVVRCTFVSLRRRLLDPDNLAGSTKHLQDAVCETIGWDDGDERIRFQYEQVLTTGVEGVLVKLDI